MAAGWRFPPPAKQIDCSLGSKIFAELSPIPFGENVCLGRGNRKKAGTPGLALPPVAGFDALFLGVAAMHQLHGESGLIAMAYDTGLDALHRFRVEYGMDVGHQSVMA